MATPTLGLLTYTSINTAESTTNWTTFDTLDSDIKKEGNNGITGTFRADLTAGHYDNGSAPATAASKHIRMWVNTTNVPYMESTVNGGYEFYMNDGSTTEYYTIFSSEDYFGGWFNMVIDCNLFTTLTLANVQQWGIRVNHTTNAKNVDNMWVDYIRYLDGYYITGGTSGDKVTPADVAVADRGTTTLYGYGIIEEIEGVYLGYGKIQLGNGATTTYFEMDGDVLVFTDQPVADGLYAINGNGSGADIVITGSTIKSAGSAAATRFDFDMVTSSPNSVEVTNNVFQRGGAFTFTSGQTVTGNSFSDCQQITAGGADLSGSTVSFYSGTADTAAIVWNVNSDTDGYLDDMTFTTVSGGSTHAIQLGTSSPTEVTFNNITFSGYDESNAQNDSTLLVSRTTGTVTINLVGCSGNISYKTSGAAVDLVIDPVVVSVTAKDSTTASGVENARVFMHVADDSNYPYQDSVTISGTGGTATVDHINHGLKNGELVFIEGAEQYQYNGVKTITYVDADTYTYTYTGSPVSPATGTITATFTILYGLTNSSGYISTQKSFGFNQPVNIFVRKASGSPYYKAYQGSGTISSTGGLASSVSLISDE